MIEQCKRAEANIIHENRLHASVLENDVRKIYSSLFIVVVVIVIVVVVNVIVIVVVVVVVVVINIYVYIHFTGHSPTLE